MTSPDSWLHSLCSEAPEPLHTGFPGCSIQAKCQHSNSAPTPHVRTPVTTAEKTVRLESCVRPRRLFSIQNIGPLLWTTLGPALRLPITTCRLPLLLYTVTLRTGLTHTKVLSWNRSVSSICTQRTTSLRQNHVYPFHVLDDSRSLIHPTFNTKGNPQRKRTKNK